MSNYTNEQVANIRAAFNLNKTSKASTASDNATLRGPRFLAKLAALGYSAEALAEHVRTQAAGRTDYKNIYDLLTVKALKAAGVTPTGEPQPQEPQPQPQEPQAEEPQAEPQAEEPQPQEPQPQAQAGGLLENVVNSLIDSRIQALAPTLKTAGAAAEITVHSVTGAHTVTGLKHEMFNTVLQLVANDRALKRSPYLVGPAGTGKNVLCRQVAEALGLEFYYTNCVTDEYKLIGYMDANGNYHPTPFYEAFKNGGLFMLDEIDGSCQDALINLNGALSDYEFTFPNGEKIKAADTFHAIAAGNTTGRGADIQYTGRAQQDAAALDRFIFPVIDYSPAIEESLTDDTALLDYCRAFRKACKRAAIPAVMSYRGISALAGCLQFMTAEQALECNVYAGFAADDIQNIIRDLPDDNIYTTATKKLAATL